jgi:hypothetical protein
MQYKELLAEAIENEANWRDMKADEYPDDDRNTKAARSLHGLATYVRSLAEDDRRLKVLEQLTGSDWPINGEEIREALKRVSLHQTVPPSAALDSLAEPAALDLRSLCDTSSTPSQILEELETAEPLFALALSAELEDRVADDTRQLVHQARDIGASWSVIGALTGMSRQGAQKKYG